MCLSAFRNSGFGPVEVWRNRFVAAHAVEMAYIVRCVDSDLTVADAVELVKRLVVAAPAGMVPVGGGALEHDPSASLVSTRWSR